MRTISTLPQRYVEFDELWKRFAEAELAFSGTEQPEEHQTVRGVPCIHRAGGSVAVRVQRCLLSDLHQDEGAEHGVRAHHPFDADPRLPGHFDRRISNTADVCFNSWLQRGIGTLTLVEVVHFLGPRHKTKDCKSAESSK